MRTAALFPLVCLLALACNGRSSDDETDTDTDTGPTYDPGCILVDGAGGYAHLADAMEVAGDTGVITLCEDMSEELVISTTVIIEGNGVLLEPPVNAPAVTVVDGGNLTLSDVRIASTRSGLVVEEGGVLAAADVSMETLGSYGVEVQRGGTATVDAAVMTGPDWGGARVNGGTLTLTNSTLDLIAEDGGDTAPYGVLVENDGNATLEGNTITGPARTLTEGSVFDLDGVGVWLQTGASATLRNNTVIGGSSTLAGVSADAAGELVIEGDTYLGGVTGLAVRGTTATMSDVAAQGYIQWGIVAVQSDVSMHSTTFETTPEGSVANDVGDPEDTTDDRDGSVGVYALESEVTITGTAEAPSQMIGHNRSGIVVSPLGGGSVSYANISDTVLDSNVGGGIAVYSGDLIAERLTVSNTLNDDEYCAGVSGYRCNMAIALWGSNATLTDTAVLDSNDWGLTLVQGVADVVGGTFQRNERYGAFAQAGTLTFDGTEFAEGGLYQVALLQDASAVVSNATFRDGSYVSENEFQSGETTYRTVSYYGARDILVSQSSLVVTDSTFENGEQGISANGSEDAAATVVLQDSTFSGYNQSPINASSYSEWTVERVNLTGTGRQAISCYLAKIEADKVNIRDTTRYSYRYEQYQDGELTYENEYERAERAVYANLCDLTLEDVAIEGSDGYAMDALNSSLEIDGLTVSDLFRAGADFDYSSLSPGVRFGWSRSIDFTDNTIRPQSYPTGFVNDVTISGVPAAGSGLLARDGLLIESWVEVDGDNVGELAAGSLAITGLSLGGTEESDAISGNGLTAQRMGDLQIDGFDVTNASGDSVRLTEVAGSFTGASNGRTGILTGAMGTGLAIDGTRSGGGTTPVAVALTDITIADAGRDGLMITGGADHSVSGVTVTSAGAYGATCADTTFAVCDATLSGDLGEHAGCDACVGP